MPDYVIYQESGQKAVVNLSTGKLSLAELAALVTPPGVGSLQVTNTTIDFDNNVYELNLTPDNINPTGYSIDPINLTDSKNYYIAEVGVSTRDYLDSSNWLAIRQLEGGAAMPAVWSTYRSDIATEQGTKIAAINGAADAAALEAYIQSAAYTTWPTEPTDPQI